MLKTKKIAVLVLTSLLCLCEVFAEEEKLVKPEKPYDPAAPYVMHNWGFSWQHLTRIQQNKVRSNFVWEDDFIGAFYSCQTGNLPINLYAKLGVLYPYHSMFNKMEQKSKQVILYAFDVNAGPIWTFDIFEAFKLDLAPMIHYRYQLSDKFHHNDLGLGAMATVELPVTRKFSVLLNGEFAYDFFNLGTNARMQKYDNIFSYNVDLGFRISKRGANKFHYIKNKAEREEAKEKRAIRKEEAAAKKAERKAMAQEKKEQKAQAKAEYKEALKQYKESKKAKRENNQQSQSEESITNTNR